MKEEKFEKVVKSDIDYGVIAVVSGIMVVMIVISVLGGEMNLIQLLVFAGAIVTAFVLSLCKYLNSLKVYWRKIK